MSDDKRSNEEKTEKKRKKKKDKPKLNDLLAKITPENRHEEIDFGIKGRELI